MDYTKITKQELIDLLEKQKQRIDFLERSHKEISELELIVEEKERALKDQIKARDESITSKIQIEESLKQEIGFRAHEKKVYEQEKEVSAKNYAFLQQKFNELAMIFDEYAVAFKDQVKVYEAIFKSSNYVMNVLESKIKNFNGENPEKDGKQT